MSSSYRPSRCSAVVAVALTLSSGVTLAEVDRAQEALQEIVVTAQKRPESQADVPITISTISGMKLHEAGISNLNSLTDYVPGFFMQDAPQGSFIAIRGIASGANEGFEQSVGTFVDGIYHGRSQQARTPFNDLEQVEVLQGPQSILFGKNTIAGALNITSARPTPSFDNLFSVSYDPNTEEEIYTAMVSGPLTDRLRGRIAARYREDGGYVENLTLSRFEPQDHDAAVRAWLQFDLTDNVELSFKAERNTFDRTGAPFAIVTAYPAPPGTPFAGLTYPQILHNVFGVNGGVLNDTADYKRDADNNDFSKNAAEDYGFYVDWKLGQNTLSAITAYSKYDMHERTDADFTAAPILVQPLGEYFQQWSQEIRLASPTGGRFEYLMGVYVENNHLYSQARLPISSDNLLIPILEGVVGPAAGFLANTDSPRTFWQTADTYAAFAHTTWRLTDALRANLGLRWSVDDKSARRTIELTDLNGNPLTGLQQVVVTQLVTGVLNKRPQDLSGSLSENRLLPSAGLQYNFTDAIMAYATWTQGAKAGGFDANSNNPPNPPPGSPPNAHGTFEFGPEKSTTYEIGAKMQFGRTFELNSSIYYTDYRDLQVSTFDGVGFDVENAGAARIKGMDLSSRWLATPNLQFNAAVAYTDFKFTQYIGQCNTGQTPNAPGPGGAIIDCDLSGQTNQFVSPWVETLSGSYRIPIGRFEVGATVDAYHTGSYFASTTPDPRQVQDAYTKLNARLSVGDSGGGWELALVGQNLTNALIMPFGADAPLAYSLFKTFTAVRVIEPGRTVAIQANIKFGR